MNIKPIRTSADHARALKQIEALWDAAPNSPDADTLDVLATLVDAYERAHFHIPAPDPIAAIQFRLEQSGRPRSVLHSVFKTTARLSEIMNRRRPLNLSMIRRLNEEFAIPLESLVGEYPLQKARSAGRTAAHKAAKRSSAKPRTVGTPRAGSRSGA